MTSTGWKNNVTADGPKKDDKLSLKDWYAISVSLSTMLCIFGAIIGGLLYLNGIDFGESISGIWILLAFYTIVGIVIIDEEYYQ